MATKPRTPIPVDKPLARAYLREFSGWSTAYSPGLSDPSTLRVMENCMITREGALAVRPALRSIFPAGYWINTNLNARILGSFETFFLNDGTKALLFATKEPNGSVVFRAARYNEATRDYSVIPLEQAGFTGLTPAMHFSSSTTYVRYLQIDNKIFALADSPNPADSARVFHVGALKTVRLPQELYTHADWNLSYAPTVIFPSSTWINAENKAAIPTASGTNAGTTGQPHTGTLVSSSGASNTYSFGYFYTFENDFGESPTSPMSVVRAKRAWTQWLMNYPASGGGPGAVNSNSDPTRAADQFVAVVPADVWNHNVTRGTTKWNLYMVAWSDQGSVPVEGVLVASREIPPGATRETHGWLQHTPIVETHDISLPLPTREERTNYSKPPTASQGVVAGDRIILVNDRQNAAVIRWSSNQLGEYTNFSSSKGGGFKTLTSGNLLVPACVKLWQNPQSVDSLVVLCRGVDGYSTSYYMGPAEVTGQTGSTSIMAFEETTATPGTVSPWGVEVVNQGLYHPLDEQLMKSTAANYNISHKSMSEQIANKWLELRNKQNIVSASLDNRVYYIVENPDGEPLESGCMGNEIWVLDVAESTPTWSRWLIQANSLHKLEVDDKLYMAVVRPDSIFVLDDLATHDEFSQSGQTNYKAISWQVETNTQGANRAHDALAHLQRIEVTMGNFLGRFKIGVRGWDVNGKLVEVEKITISPYDFDLRERPLPWDVNDYLQVKRDLKEWRLYMGSVTEPDGDVAMSYGQVNLVQYAYTPLSVNAGYEFGSVETFEYGRASSFTNPATMYPNGVPLSYVDTMP